MNTNQLTETPQNRAEFIRSLGLSSAALMSFYCMTTLTSCSSKSDPAPANPTTPTTTALTGNAETAKGKIDATLDLTTNDYKALKTQGEFVRVGDLLIANVKGGKYVAIQRLCTHQGLDTVGYQLASDDFKCTTHGSVFATDGSIKNGPAAKVMKAYKTTISPDGNKLQVTE
jgi:cytochrome b6-f complex iron-sulfur subunit